jgi:hypothetical protein
VNRVSSGRLRRWVTRLVVCMPAAALSAAAAWFSAPLFDMAMVVLGVQVAWLVFDAASEPLRAPSAAPYRRRSAAMPPITKPAARAP